MIRGRQYVNTLYPLFLMSVAIFALVFFCFLTTSYSVLLWRCCGVNTAGLILFGSSAELHYEVGNFYFGGGDYDISKAENNFKEAAQTAEEEHITIPGLHYQLARLYFIQGNFFEAKKEIDKELLLFPDYKRSYYVRGLINGYAGKYAEAEADFKSFLAWKPESWAGHNDLVWIYFTKGDYKNAEHYAREGLQYAPDNPWLNNALGVALLNLKEYSESALYLQKALQRFEQMTPADWGIAYPGNNPSLYQKGFDSTKDTIKKNLKLAEEKSGVNPSQGYSNIYPGLY